MKKNMLRPTRLLGQSLLSLLDQACLSALNLVLGLVLIRLVSKEDYGVYSQLFAAGLFATSLLEAIIFNPMVNLAAGRPAPRRTIIIGHMSRYQGHIGTLLAVALGAACTLVAQHTGQAHPFLLGGIFGIFVKTNAWREYARSVAFLTFRPARVLRLDLWYGACVLLALAALVGLSRLSIAGLFLAFALANVAALAACGLARPRREPPLEDYRETLRQAWRRGRLALPGAALAWGVNYSYLYLAAAWLGVAATAELTASRLLLMPIALSVVAWARVARPRIGELMARQSQKALDALLRRSVLALSALAALYVAALFLAPPWLQHHVLAGKYDGVQPLLLLWGLYFLVYTARWVGTMALMGQDGYGFMLIESILSFCAMLLALTLAVDRYGVPGAIIALIVVELFSLAMTWGRYWQQKRA